MKKNKVYRTADPTPKWAIWSWYHIPDPVGGQFTYMSRLRILQTPWFGIYIHWIYLPDTDRYLHDHPWNFFSMILSGGYSEQIESGKVIQRRRFSFAFRKAERFHRIVKLNRIPTKTLCIVGRRRRDWGFDTDRGWERWDEYIFGERENK